MWLINTETLAMQEFGGNVEDEDFPKYAILSHRWRKDEISHQQLRAGGRSDSAGYRKVKQCCKFARQGGLKWAWVDTCCIDKRSSAELTEAINSMFKWYEHSQECYVYLDDIGLKWHERYRTAEQLLSSTEWVGRGWTLQELIAPLRTIFIGPDWRVIGRIWKVHPASRGHWSPRSQKHDTIPQEAMTEALARVTSVPQEVICSTHALARQSIASKMSWMSNRRTTRIEDEAYCLLGLFGINMPLLYGEGHKAFERLQREIVQQTSDETILAKEPKYDRRLFAYSAADFQYCQEMHRTLHYDRVPYVMTNQGLRFKYRRGEGVYERSLPSPGFGESTKALLIVLNCRVARRQDAPFCVLYLERARCGHYIRSVLDGYVVLDYLSERDLVNIGARPDRGRRRSSHSRRRESATKKGAEGSTRVIYIHAGEEHHAACEVFGGVGVEPAVEMMQDLSD